MTAQVHIQLTDVKNVLTIPLSALGARNDTDVEIVKGLEAGDEVVIGEAKPGAAQ